MNTRKRLYPTVVVHQPHFLPWLGYYNKITNADILIIQDNVQFRRRYFQNRTIIRNSQGNPQWLTIPVKASRSTLIKDVQVATNTWADKVKKILNHSYGRFPFFKQYYEEIYSVLRNDDKYLVDINQITIQATLKLMGLSTEMKRASSLDVKGTRTERMIALCKHFKARGYIYGEGGERFCHPEEDFESNNISTYQQRFRHQFYQKLINYRPTTPNVSILEFLFQHGATQTRNLIESCWNSEEDEKYEIPG